jgi:hypothetical protein
MGSPNIEKPPPVRVDLRERAEAELKRLRLALGIEVPRDEWMADLDAKEKSQRRKAKP